MDVFHFQVIGIYFAGKNQTIRESVYNIAFVQSIKIVIPRLTAKSDI